MKALKSCTRCGTAKPLEDFYANANGSFGRMPYCKVCDNARPRTASQSKVNRNRARHRAIADLIERHPDEFATLLAARNAEAQQEAEALAVTPQAATHFASEPVRLRPGKRMPGQKAGDRIDVARCGHCIKHHDQGHVCKSCGMAPQAALRLPDDGTVDEIAVERAMNGDPVRLTRAEQVEAIRRMVDRGMSDSQIAAALHCTAKTVERRRGDYAIESRWTA